MNQRLLELHNQCIVREQRGTNAFDSYMVDRFDSDLFAKLIVQDCVQTLVNHVHRCGQRLERGSAGF
jgi:hypothetical protein